MRILLALFLSFTGFHAVSQVAPPESLAVFGDEVTRLLTNRILARQVAVYASAARTTGLSQRLIAQSMVDDAGREDSVRYFWNSNSRPAIHNPKDIGSYFNSYTPYVPAFSGFDRRASLTLYIPADSIDHSVWNAGEQSRAYQYNAAGKPVRFTDYAAGQPYSVTTLSYNAAGHMTLCTTTQAFSSIPQSRQFSTYSGNGLLLTDSLIDYRTSSNGELTMYIYTYSNAAQLTQIKRFTYSGSFRGIPEDSSRNQFLYNSDGLLLSVSDEAVSNGRWQLKLKDSFTYSGNNPAYTGRYYIFYSQGFNPVPTAMSYTLSTLNNVGNWSSQRTYLFDNTTQTHYESSRRDFIYNSINNYESFLDYDTNNGIYSPTPTRVYRFYYQTYDPAAVGTCAASATLQVRPNPARNAFQVRRATSVPAAYRLTDVTGHVVLAGVLPTESELLETRNLAAGLYLLTVQEAGYVPQTIRVVLQ